MPSSRFRFGGDRLISSGFRFGNVHLSLCLLWDLDSIVTIYSHQDSIRQRSFNPMPSLRFRFDDNPIVSSGFRFSSDHLILCFPKILSLKVALFSHFRSPKIFHFFMHSSSYPPSFSLSFHSVLSFSLHPTYASSPMLFKHVSRYIFQHHHDINDKKQKTKNIYAKIPKIK